jgi:hypothetical protein
MLKRSNAQPDILVLESNVSPVVIETEVLPAITVEKDAVARLGEQIRTTGGTILSSVAVRFPVRLRTKQGKLLQSELSSANDIEMAVYTGSSASKCSRWPRSGWILGSVTDLSILTQSASVPPEVIDEAANLLVEGVNEAACLLEEMAKPHPGAIHMIGGELRQEDGPQTRRMATAILANAFVFHETLAGGSGDLAAVHSLEQLRVSSGGLSKSGVLAEWRKILKVNYWPIFDIARRILATVPTPGSSLLIEGLAGTAEKLLQNRLMRSHDLTGAVFQRLIADRKFLAAYYTTPAAAALLVGLSITKENPPSGGSWSSEDDVKSLRIADFACGTGTLLSTAYQRVGQLHELAGGDSESLHSDMMATALVGCDVLPAAAHLTASMLAGAHPTVKYKQSSILTVAYGKQEDGAIALGSLDLLDPQRKFEILSITAKAAEGMGEAERETWSTLPHASFDMVLMNPPFTRATGHHEINKVGVPNPMFAAFSSTEEEQQLMSAATKRLTEGTSAHGNAGEASIFLVLADRKLKTGGVMGLVMPLSLMSGDAWENSRVLLRKNYQDLLLISISGVDGGDLSFSADTDMGECLIIGRKEAPINGRRNDQVSKRATFVILKERPGSTLLGYSTARQIRQLIEQKSVRQIEDGPTGGTPLYFGKDEIGQVLEAPLPDSGGWNLSRIADLALAQSAYQLVDRNRVWLPTMAESDFTGLPITTVNEIGKIGPVDRDISGTGSAGAVRGPFTISSIKPDSAPTYPVLWAHEAERERTMMFPGDSEGRPLLGKTKDEQRIIDAKVVMIQATASYCHFNRDFRFNSQSTSMQFTPRRTIGGRAWLSISLPTPDQEKVLVLWANTSLGLLLYWWHANKPQAGRGSIPRLKLTTMPILDVCALKPKQMREGVKIFDSMNGEQLLPLHQIDIDPIRKQLDEEFGRKVLGLPESILGPSGPLELLRMKLSREPSIRGQKLISEMAEKGEN